MKKWSVRVEPCRVGWYLTAIQESDGDTFPRQLLNGRFALTKAGATRKARRWVRRLNRTIERRKAETFVVG